jgi:hypothetical protein
MGSVTLPRVVAAAAVLSATVLVLATRERNTGGVPAAAFPAAELPVIDGARDDGPAPAEDAVAAKRRELTAMSETYRNTTFLIAIRDAGFVCHDLESVYGGVNSSTTWTAHCRDMLAYTVGISSSGALLVEPMMPHLDSTPRPIQREGGRSPLPPSPLQR